MIAQASTPISTEWTVAGYWFKGLLQTASKLGLSRERVFGESGLAHSSHGALDSHYPMADLFRLAQVIRMMSNDADIGIQYCMSTHICDFGVLGMAAHCTANLREAWDVLYRFSHLSMNSGRAQFLNEGPTVTFRWYPYSRSLISDRFFVDAVVSGWVHRSRQLSGYPIQPLQVTLSYARTRMSDLFRNTYSDNVTFEQPFNSMTFKAEDLDRAVVYANSDLKGELLKYATQTLRRLRSKRPLSERLENHLKESLLDGQASIQNVAKQLNFSTRSLQRKLSHENASFNEILTSVRHELALRYLQDRRLSTQDIALLLGYNQASTFSTAFKEWTSVSPSSYRHRTLDVE